MSSCRQSVCKRQTPSSFSRLPSFLFSKRTQRKRFPSRSSPVGSRKKPQTFRHSKKRLATNRFLLKPWTRTRTKAACETFLSAKAKRKRLVSHSFQIGQSLCPLKQAACLKKRDENDLRGGHFAFQAYESRSKDNVC
jgi:hypothetical protein